VLDGQRQKEAARYSQAIQTLGGELFQREPTDAERRQLDDGRYVGVLALADITDDDLDRLLVQSRHPFIFSEDGPHHLVIQPDGELLDEPNLVLVIPHNRANIL